MSADKTPGQELDDGARMDRAVQAGFADAVRLHREANLPMAIWENEQVRLVSPFDIPLPGEDPADVPRRHVQGAD
jgi:hypothetical protein